MTVAAFSAGLAVTMSLAAHGMANAQSNPFTANKLTPLAGKLVGQWQSIEDPKAAIVFLNGQSGLKQVDRYDGAPVGQAYPVLFPLTCGGARASQTNLLMQVGTAPDELCYALTMPTENTLDLEYLIRGSVLRYERVVASAGSPPVAPDLPTIDPTRPYRLRNAGFARLQQDMCADIFNGGPQDNEPDMRECAGYSGQIWNLTPHGATSPASATYTMTTQFRGPDMCLTIVGTLLDNILRLLPCGETPSDEQLWKIVAWKGEDARATGALPSVGWTIQPLLGETGKSGQPMFLVVDTPPEGDGRPYLDFRDFVGDGFLWNLTPE